MARTSENKPRLFNMDAEDKLREERASSPKVPKPIDHLSIDLGRRVETPTEMNEFIENHGLLEDKPDLIEDVIYELYKLHEAIETDKLPKFLEENAGRPIEKISKAILRKTSKSAKGIPLMWLDTLVIDTINARARVEQAKKLAAAKQAVANTDQINAAFNEHFITESRTAAIDMRDLPNKAVKEKASGFFQRHPTLAKFLGLGGLVATTVAIQVAADRLDQRGHDEEGPTGITMKASAGDTTDAGQAEVKRIMMEHAFKAAGITIPNKAAGITIPNSVETVKPTVTMVGSKEEVNNKVEDNSTSLDMNRSDVESYPIPEGGTFASVLKKICEKHELDYKKTYTRMANGNRVTKLPDGTKIPGFIIINNTGKDSPWDQVPGFLLHPGDVVTPSFDEDGNLFALEVTHPTGGTPTEKASSTGGATTRGKKTPAKKAETKNTYGAGTSDIDSGAGDEEGGEITFVNRGPSSLNPDLDKKLDREGGIAGWNAGGVRPAEETPAVAPSAVRKNKINPETFDPRGVDFGIDENSGNVNFTGSRVLGSKLILGTPPKVYETQTEAMSGISEKEYLASEIGRALAEHNTKIGGDTSDNLLDKREAIMNDWAFINDITRLTSDATIKTVSETESERRINEVKKRIRKLSSSDWQRLASTTVKQLENMGGDVGVEANTFMASFNPDNLSAHNIDQYRQVSREHLLTFEKYLLQNLGLDYSLLLNANKQKIIQEAIAGGEYYKKVWLPIVEFKNKILTMQYGETDQRIADYHLGQKVTLSEAEAALSQIGSELKNDYNLNTGKDVKKLETDTSKSFDTTGNQVEMEKFKQAEKKANDLWDKLNLMARKYNKEHGIKGAGWAGIKGGPEYQEWVTITEFVKHASDKMTMTDDLEKNWLAAGDAGKARDLTTAEATKGWNADSMIPIKESPVAVNNILISIKKLLEVFEFVGPLSRPADDIHNVAVLIKDAIDNGEIGSAGANKIKNALQKNQDLFFYFEINEQFDRLLKISPEEKPFEDDEEIVSPDDTGTTDTSL